MQMISERGRFNGWRLSPPIPIDGTTAVYAEIGKAKTQSVSKFVQGRYRNELITVEPFTYLFVDPDVEICAIGYEKQLPHPKTIAGELRKMLTRIGSELFPSARLEFDIQGIVDPNRLVEAVHGAFQVTFLSLTFRRPNAFDINKMIIQPTQKIIDEMGAKSGGITMSGDDLDRRACEDVIRSVSSTGDAARVKVREKPGGKLVSKSTRDGNPATIEQDIVEGVVPLSTEPRQPTQSAMRQLMRRMKDFYGQMRGRQLSQAEVRDDDE